MNLVRLPKPPGGTVGAAAAEYRPPGRTGSRSFHRPHTRAGACDKMRAKSTCSWMPLVSLAFPGTYTHAHRHAYMYACRHAQCMQCLHEYMITCVHTYMHTRMNAHMNACTRAYFHTRMRIHE